VSLSSLLSTGGPVRTWFETYFVETKAFCADANRELRGGPAKDPCVVAPVPGTDHAFVGTAAGYILSAHLREDALERTVATEGADWLPTVRVGTVELEPLSIERTVVVRIGQLAPWRESLGDDDWLELCRLCGILTRFEQCYRAGPPVFPYTLEPIALHGGNLDALGAAMISDASLQDVSALGRAAVEDHGHLRDASSLHIGPTFAQSRALGGADADVIYDGVLLDFKSTTQPGVIGRQEAWQLLGYLFADTDNQYGIERVGIGALRRRRAITWEAQEYLNALAGFPTMSVEQWRAEFAELLAAVSLSRIAPGPE
jgi:hypothetical protein